MPASIDVHSGFESDRYLLIEGFLPDSLWTAPASEYI